MRVAHLVLEQTVALAHRLFIVQRRLARGRERSSAPCGPESAAAPRPLDPEPVHRRDEPDRTRTSRPRPSAGRLAVDLEPAGRAASDVDATSWARAARAAAADLPAEASGCAPCPAPPRAAARARAKTATPPRSGWSCRPRWARQSPRADRRAASAARAMRPEMRQRQPSTCTRACRPSSFAGNTGRRPDLAQDPAPVTPASASRHRPRWCRCLRASGSDRRRS